MLSVFTHSFGCALVAYSFAQLGTMPNLVIKHTVFGPQTEGEVTINVSRLGSISIISSKLNS